MHPWWILHAWAAACYVAAWCVRAIGMWDTKYLWHIIVINKWQSTYSCHIKNIRAIHNIAHSWPDCRTWHDNEINSILIDLLPTAVSWTRKRKAGWLTNSYQHWLTEYDEPALHDKRSGSSNQNPDRIPMPQPFISMESNCAPSIKSGQDIGRIWPHVFYADEAGDSSCYH